MAAPKENSLSLGYLTGTERSTFTKQREHSLKKRPMMLQADFSTPQSQQIRAMHLHQRWQELRERELTAQQHNRQLLQQFDAAQDTLRQMLSLTAAMKTIRMGYERYLEGERSPHWQQQLKENTQAAQKKEMEEYLCLKNTKEQVTKSSPERPFPFHGPDAMPQNNYAPPKHYSQKSHWDYNQDGSSHLHYMQSSWQTHPQSHTVRLPIRAPYQPQGASHVPPSFLPHPHSFQIHQSTASTPVHHQQPRPRQNPPCWASLQPDPLRSWVAGTAGITSGPGALWSQLDTGEPAPEMGAGEEADTSRAPSSNRESGAAHSSQELDIKPVRLSGGGHAESSESSRESGQVSREKRKKRAERGRSQCSSSERSSCSSQESSVTSSAVVTAAVTAAQSSESDDSSGKGRTSSRRVRRRQELAAGSPTAEKVAEGSEGVDSGSHKEESKSTSEELGSQIEEFMSEKAGNQSPVDKSESCGEKPGSQREEESTSVRVKIENKDGDEMKKQERSSSEQSAGEKVGEDLGDGDEDDGDAEEEEKSQTDEQQEEREVEDEDEASEKKDTTEEEEETGAEDEVEDEVEESEGMGDREEKQSDRLKSDNGENRKRGSASSQDEEVDEDETEGGEENMEEDRESDEEEQRGAEEPEEERDSDDSIISPQDNKSKKLLIIPEEGSEEDDEEEEYDEEEGSKTGSSDNDLNEFSDEDDVEQLLAPQEQAQKKTEKDPRAEEKPKAICDSVEIFQVEPDKSESDHPSDSDEFDHFYG